MFPIRQFGKLFFPRPLGVLLQDRHAFAEIADTEEIEVVEQMVEPIDGESLLGAGRQRVHLGIPIVEPLAHAAKESEHSELGFPISVIACGIDQHGAPAFVRKVVAAPKVSVQQGWRILGLGKQLVEPRRQPVAKPSQRGTAQPLLGGQFQLWLQTLSAPELNPRTALLIGLRGRAKIVVHRKSVVGPMIYPAELVKSRQLASKLRLVEAPARRDPFQHQECWMLCSSVVHSHHLGNTNGVGDSHRLQSCRFRWKHVVWRQKAPLGKQSLPIAQSELRRGTDAAAAERVGVDDAAAVAGMAAGIGNRRL